MSIDPYTSPKSDHVQDVDPHTPGTIAILFRFKGRIARRTFWLHLIPVLIPFGMSLIALEAQRPSPDLHLRDNDSFIPTTALFMGITLMLALLTWILVALQVKRWHDHSKSAWWLLIWLTPLGLLWVIVELGLVRGSPYPNKYGPDPLRIKKSS